MVSAKILRSQRVTFDVSISSIALMSSVFKPAMVLMTKSQVDKHLKAEVLPLEQTLPPLTRRQFKLALLHAGLTDEINTAIAGIDDATLKAVIEIEYNEATEFRRTSDSVKYMCNLLSLTNDEINELWLRAANH